MQSEYNGWEEKTKPTSPRPGLEKMTTTARRGEATRGAIIDKSLRSHLSRDPDAKEIK